MLLLTAGELPDVKFLINQVGTANAATRFLNRLRETLGRDENFAKVVYVTSGMLSLRCAHHAYCLTSIFYHFTALPGGAQKDFDENLKGLDRWVSTASVLALQKQSLVSPESTNDLNQIFKLVTTLCSPLTASG